MYALRIQFARQNGTVVDSFYNLSETHTVEYIHHDLPWVKDRAKFLKQSKEYLLIEIIDLAKGKVNVTSASANTVKRSNRRTNGETAS